MKRAACSQSNSMRENWDDKIIEYLLDYGVWLPLTLTVDSKNRAIRILGLFCFFVWFPPAIVILGVPCLIMFVIAIICTVWRGDW